MTYFFIAGPYVKIGSTKNLAKRVASIRTHCPYRVSSVRFSESIREVDAHRHAIQMSGRVGEWFELNERLENWIQSIPDIQTFQPFKCKTTLHSAVALPVAAQGKAHSSLSETLGFSFECLSPSTKDYLLRLHMSTGRPVAVLIRFILNKAAANSNRAA